MQTKNERKIILFGAGIVGENALWLYGARNVYCFADNFKNGQMFCSKKVISFDEVQKIGTDYKIIISTSARWLSGISNQLEKADINFSVYWDDLTEYQLSIVDTARIKKFKNRYNGQKVFLLGNGPSLNVQDLEKLQENNIKTFACNLIHKIFDKTNWRPDFYCCAENSAILLSKNFIQNLPITAKFIKCITTPQLMNVFNGEPVPDDINFFIFSDRSDGFSQDVSHVVYVSYTIMFSMIEFAVYMGFKEIYLLGVENTQPPTVHTKDFIERNTHFYEEDKSELEKRKMIMGVKEYVDNNWELYQKRTTDCYIRAKAYADEHGIKIYNATRGGILEVFDRVDFDKLF